MIISLEGIDGVGKTTMWNVLRRQAWPYPVTFVGGLTPPSGYLANVQELEPYFVSLIRQLIRPDQIYIWDRFPSITSRAYGVAEHRAPYALHDADLLKQCHVMYFWADYETVNARLIGRDGVGMSNERYIRLMLAYERARVTVQNLVVAWDSIEVIDVADLSWSSWLHTYMQSKRN